MENPYHRAEIIPHYLDRELARVKCFDVYNILSASMSLAGEYEMADPEEPQEFSAMFKLHHRLAEPRISQLLLEIAVFVRTFDDQMGSIAPDEYAAFCKENDGENYIGVLDGDGDLRLREACNKIIHATSFKPLYNHVDRPLEDGSAAQAWHLDGEIELEGYLRKKRWEAVITIENFLEIVLDRLEFEPPPHVEDEAEGT